MEVIQTSNSTRKHVREPPSIPFLWEAWPGIPKRDWKPDPLFYSSSSSSSSFSSSSSSLSSVSEVPRVKLIASVPFLWEEKPGKPLPSQELVLYNNYIPGDFDDESIDYLWDDNNEDREILISAPQTNAPSLLRNCLVSWKEISSAVPASGNIDAMAESESESETESEMESETGSGTTSSYLTGHSSLVGSSFLENLFPLFPPNSGFLWKDGGAHKTPEFGNRKIDLESNKSVTRRLSTLGELIMMSRRRSCRRKGNRIAAYDISMELTKAGALGCCGFGNRGKPKQLPRLKLAWHKQKHQIESFFGSGATSK